MNKKLEVFLRDINKGKLQGAQRRISEMLDLSEAAVSRWIKGKAFPSDENILKLAKLTKKNPDELRNIFGTDIEESNNLATEIKLLKETVKRHEAELELLKSKIKK